MRINARLDDERAEKLQQLQALTRLSTSEIVKRAIDLLHRQQAGRSRDKLDALLSSDFVGCAKGPADLASQYKRYLIRDLEEKLGEGRILSIDQRDFETYRWKDTQPFHNLLRPFAA